MKIIRMSLKEDEFEELELAAKAYNITVQDYIRKMLFTESSIFSPEEALCRAQNLREKREESFDFYLSDLYSEEEWSELSRGESGVFGRRWYTFTEGIPEIQYLGNVRRKAKYRIQ